MKMLQYASRDGGTDEHLGDFIMGYPMNMDQMNSFVNAMVKNTNAWVIVEKESGACIGLNCPLCQGHFELV